MWLLCISLQYALEDECGKIPVSFLLFYLLSIFIYFLVIYAERSLKRSAIATSHRDFRGLLMHAFANNTPGNSISVLNSVRFNSSPVTLK